MLLLDSEALSALAQGPASRRDRVRALIVEMRRRELPIATVAAELAVNAFLIAVSDLAGGAVGATVYFNDLRRLAAYANQVSIVGLAP